MIPVLVGGATITVAITTALAQANGAFNGRVPLTPYLCGYAVAFILLCTATAIAMVARREKSLPPSPIRQENKQTVESNPQQNVYIGEEFLQRLREDKTPPLPAPVHQDNKLQNSAPHSPTLLENLPAVRPYEYGKDPQQHLCGLFVTNPGYAAFDVHIPPVRVGTSGYRLTFRETLTQLLERDHKRFISAWLEHETLPGRDGSQLFDTMKASQVEQLEFGIVYKDNSAHPRWHRTNCSIERDVELVPGGLRVRYLNQEMLPEGYEKHDPRLRG